MSIEDEIAAARGDTTFQSEPATVGVSAAYSAGWNAAKNNRPCVPPPSSDPRDRTAVDWSKGWLDAWNEMTAKPVATEPALVAKPAPSPANKIEVRMETLPKFREMTEEELRDRLDALERERHEATARRLARLDEEAKKEVFAAVVEQGTAARETALKEAGATGKPRTTANWEVQAGWWLELYRYTGDATNRPAATTEAFHQLLRDIA